MTPSYYELLGVDTAASGATIKTAYLQKAKECHPDKGGDHATFVTLQKAYNVLCDTVAREQYDQTSRRKPPNAFTEVIQKNDLKKNDDEAAYFYDCRCGDSVCVPFADLQDGIEIFPCDSCSLSIKVK